MRLMEWVRADLKKSGIAYADIKERLVPMSRAEFRAEYGKDYGCHMLGFKYGSGRCRFKLRRPYSYTDRTGKRRTMKYWQQGGTPPEPYIVAPETFDDPGVVVTYCEGEKKAECLSASGIPSIGLPGVNGFGSKRHGIDLLPALKALAQQRRRFDVAFDGNTATNPNVRHAREKFCRALLANGAAEVRTVDVPGGLNLDDYVVAEGIEAFKKLPRRVFRSEASRLPASLRDLKPDPSWYDAKPPEAEYILPPYLQMGEVGQATAQAGAGKSTWLITMQAAIATATPFFGYPVSTARKTAYFMLERQEASFRRRFHKVTHALAARLDAGPRKQFESLLRRNCIMKAIAGEWSSIVELDKQQWRPAALLDDLIAELKAARIEVLILDPLSRLHGGKEDNEVFSAITKALERIAVEVGCAVIFAHHTGQNARTDMYAGRGGSAINDNTSETIVLSVLDEKERARLDLSGTAKDCDIVLVHHARCSDGRPAPDMHLMREPATGLLRRIHVQQRSEAAVLHDLLPKLRAWDASSAGMTCNSFVTNREIFGLAKHKAEKLFAEAVENGTFVPTGALRRGFPMYRLRSGVAAELPKLPGNSRVTGKHAKRTRQGDSQNG